MSRSTTLESPSAVADRRAPGRHRLDVAGGVRCSELPAVAARLERSATPRTGLVAWLRALLPSVPTGRHTWDFLSNAGGRPRSAFAIILSL
ncbi:hypothetical protein [Klenkia terrae]|jgi:hypothetical protein|uniref:Uncharacterized protein n=1 Tax=Klenkia terrae TaxID=1052259 RepID=A0ABU8E2K8_9ACTN|nr:hypothetical protein [Klenkia terrae]SSC21627.1 Hypothetical protein KLENKIAIHU_200 [Klenkia terrae]